MIQVIALLNPFSAEKTQFETDKKSIKEIIEKIDPYKAVNTGWRVLIDDVIITDFDLIPEDGQTVYIKLVPEGGGTPKEQGGAMKFVGYAMSLVGGILTLTGVGSGLGLALIGTGIGMVAGGTILMNVNIPSLNDRESPEQSPSIRGSRNQMRQLGVIPYLFGTRRIYADLAATSYTWVDRNGNQYLYQLFCAGQKDIEIDTSTIKIADTLLADYSSGSIDNILAGADPIIRIQIASGAGTPPLVTKCVHEEQRNSQLKNKTEEGLDGSVIWTTPDKTEGINVDIFFYNGLGKYNDDGDVVSTSVRVGAWYKKATEPDSAYQVLGYFSGSSDTISGSELKTKRYAIDKTGLEAGQYTVKVSRISTDSDDNKIVDAVYLGSIRAIKNTAPVSPETCKKLTLIGLKIKASEKLSNVIDQLNFVATAKLPVYSGSGTGQNAWNTVAKTENPASCALAAMQSDFTQQKLTEKEIDWQKIESWYTWCDEHNYTCNEYVAESISISQLLMAIASTSRAEVFRLNGKLTMVQDIERTAAVQLFTPRNSFGYTETIMFADIPDAMAIGFVDKKAGYAENELSIYNTKSGNKENEPNTSQDVSLWGVTDSEQARRLGMYKFAVTKNRPIVHKFSCDFEYLLCSKGDWIKYAGDIALAGLKQGRIAEVIYDNGNVTGFVSDEVLPMEAGKSYAVRIRKNNAEIVLYKLKTAPGNNLEVFFDFPLSGSGLNEGDLFAFGVVNTETIDLIITDIQPGENLSADITAVEYSPAIFDVDKPDFVLPDFENKITPVPGAVDSGEISGWNTWYTYNDQKNMPDRPTGDGTANGWHRIQTSQSMWQSSKTAAKITDGTWSVPTPTGALAVDEILGGQTEIGVPDKPSRIEAVAEEKGIAVKAQINTLGLKNTIQTYIWSLNKGSEWQEIESQSSSDLIPFSKNEYPEYSDLQNWKIRLRLKNVYGKFSDYSDEVSINTDTYGTWKLLPPKVTVSVSNRAINLKMEQPQRSDNRPVYGTLTHRIEVKNPKIDTEFFKPAESLDPYAAELNYKEGSGYVTSVLSYTQIMPLEGQNDDPPGPTYTLYQFRITAANEATTSEPTIQNATANPTSVYDMVKGWYKNEQGEKVKIPGALGAESIYTESLAAISANMGDITAGKISSVPEAGQTKPNVLLDLDNEEFRIGNKPSLEDSGSDEAEYIHYRKGQGLIMKIKNFVVTALASIVSGIFRVKAKSTADSESFFVVNPESTTDSTTDTPGKTVKINGGQMFPYNYGVRYYKVPDMRGLPRVILISDISEFWTSPETTTHLPKQGFCGFLTFCRDSYYTTDGGAFVECVVSYQNKNTSIYTSVVQLRYNPAGTKNYVTGKPCIVKYNERYYLSLHHKESNTYFQLYGAMYNLLPEFQTVLESDLEVIQEGTIETITDDLTVTGGATVGGGISTDNLTVKEESAFNKVYSQTINGLQLKNNNFNGTIVGRPLFGFDIDKFKYSYTAIGDVLPIGILTNDKPLNAAVNIANVIFYFKFGTHNNYKDAYEALKDVLPLDSGVVPVLGYYKESVDAMAHIKVGSIKLIRFYYKYKNSGNYFDVAEDTTNPFASNFSILFFNNS